MSRRAPRRTTVPRRKPATSRPASTPQPARAPWPRPAARQPSPRPAARREVGRIFDAPETSLADLIDNLLNRGVVLNADIVLALADVDLVYLRLSALLCAADRVLPTPQ